MVLEVKVVVMVVMVVEVVVEVVVRGGSSSIVVPA